MFVFLLLSLLSSFFRCVPLLRPASKRQATGYDYFEISATFKSSKLKKGIRATVFKSAEKYHGRCRGSIGQSIFYPPGSDDLKVHLLFKEERDAQDFLVELSRLQSEHHRFRDMIGFEREPVEVTIPNAAPAVYFSDYVTTDSDSPQCLSLADVLTQCSTLTTVPNDPHDPRLGLNSFENFTLLAPYQKLYRCHIASKKDHPKYARDMDNNIIYASQDFHNYFDGMQTDSGEPEIALQYVGTDGECEVLVDRDGTHEKRFKVFVRVIFREEAIAEFMRGRFRDYTEESPLSPLVFRSYLFMKDLKIAQEVLDIKYNETIAMWNVHGVDSDSDN